MAKTGGRPPTFFGFLHTTTLPTDPELTTFLVAMKQPNAVMEKFRSRLKKLERQLKDEQTDSAIRSGTTSLTSASTASLVINLDNSDLQALLAAQAAQTPTDLSAALAQFRSTAQVTGKDEPPSFKDMEKISGKRLSKSTAQRLTTATTLPAKATHVEEYLRACGATDEHVALWITEYQRLRRGEAPILGHHAGTAPTSDTTPPSRTRAEGILAGLTDTDAFTATRLSLDGRKLILFITAAIADDTGSAETTYRAVLLRWGTVRDHWAFDVTLPELATYLAQYVGRTARKVPLWPMIHDLLDVAVRDPEARTQVLADAAGLYNQVTGEPPPDHATTMHLPWWGYPVTGRTQLDTIRSTLPRPGHKLTTTELELNELREDNTRYRQALDTALRGLRALTARETQLAAREAELASRELWHDIRERRTTTRKHPLTKRQRQLAQQQPPTTPTNTANKHEPLGLPNTPQPDPLSPSYWPLQHASGT